MIGTILLNIDGIKIGFDVGTDLSSLDGSLDGFNDGNLEGFFLENHWYLLVVKCLVMIKE